MSDLLDDLWDWYEDRGDPVALELARVSSCVLTCKCAGDECNPFSLDVRFIDLPVEHD